MQTKPIRTTIQIDPILYGQVKIKMGEKDLRFRQMIEKSLKIAYLWNRPKNESNIS